MIHGRRWSRWALALSGLLLVGGCTEQGAFLPADEETDRKLRAIVGAEPS